MDPNGPSCIEGGCPKVPLQQTPQHDGPPDDPGNRPPDDPPNDPIIDPTIGSDIDPTRAGREIDPAQDFDAYIVSRPLNGDNRFSSHNFIVTDADYIGDPNANVYSYGHSRYGNVGRVDETTQGFSEVTYAAEVKSGFSCKSESV